VSRRSDVARPVSFAVVRGIASACSVLSFLPLLFHYLLSTFPLFLFLVLTALFCLGLQMVSDERCFWSLFEIGAWVPLPWQRFQTFFYFLLPFFLTLLDRLGVPLTWCDSRPSLAYWVYPPTFCLLRAFPSCEDFTLGTCGLCLPPQFAMFSFFLTFLTNLWRASSFPPYFHGSHSHGLGARWHNSMTLCLV